MARNYTEVFFHFVWGTKKREPLITSTIEGDLHRFIRAYCREQNILVHALNGMQDHVHLVCTLPTSLSISDATERIKGASSHFANDQLRDDTFRWQPGYGVLTFSKRDLTQIVAYVVNQKSHHAERRLSTKMERSGEEA